MIKWGGILMLLACLIQSGCVTASAPALDRSLGINHVCIEENPKVIVPDLVEVIQEGFQNHSIQTTVYPEGTVPASCEFVLKYVAYQVWDFKVYMHHARLYFEKKGVRIAEAVYKIHAQVPFSQSRDVRGKILPLIDKLLANY